MKTLSFIKDILQKDAITAGYGIATSNIRKTANKVLGKQGIGQVGVNTVLIASGVALSKVANPHLNVLGSALRVGGLVSVANSVVEKLFARKQNNESKE